MVSGLQTISLYGNPLNCDCRLSWFHSPEFSSYYSIRRDRLSVNNRTLLKPNETLCAAAGPSDVTGVPLLRELTRAASHSSAVCLPMVIPLFERITVLPLGSDLVLECRVISSGLPTDPAAAPSVIWILPDIVDRNRRVDVEQHSEPGFGSTLTVRQLQARDAGSYRCRVSTPVDVETTGNASSSEALANAQAQTILRLYNVAAGVIPVSVGSRSATVIWNGTDSTLKTAEYVIVYRPVAASGRPSTAGNDRGPCSGIENLNFLNDLASNKRYRLQRHQELSKCNITADSGAILIRPFLRKYTIGSLQPGTVYEFCMTAKTGRRPLRHNTLFLSPKSLSFADEFIRLICVNVTTRPEVFGVSASTINWYYGLLVVVGASTFVTLICTLCVVTRRRYRVRKWYDEPEMTTVTERGEFVSMRLTSGPTRDPTVYGLPLHELRPNGKSTPAEMAEMALDRSCDLSREQSPLTTSRTSLI